MPEFVLFPANANQLVFAAVILVLVFYVARIPGKTTASKIMFGLLIWGLATTLFWAIRDLYYNSGWSSWLFESSFLAGVFSLSFSTATVLLLGFAYTLGPQRFLREQRWVLGVAGALAVASWVEGFVVGGTPYLWPIQIVGSVIVSLSVLVRKWRRAPNEEERGEFNRATYAGFATFLVLCLLVLPLTLGLNALGARGAAEVILESFNVTMWVAVGLLFLQHAPEPTSLEAKFVAVACVVVLVMTSAVTAPINRPGERLKQYMPVPDASALAYLPTADGGYVAEGRVPVAIRPRGEKLQMANNGVVAVAMPFSARIFGATSDTLYVWDDGMASLGPPRDRSRRHTWQDFYQLDKPGVAVLGYDMSPADGGGVFVESSEDSVVVTWWGTPARDRNLGPSASRAMTAQLLVRRDGGLEARIGRMAFRPWVWRRGITPGAGQNVGLDLEAIDTSGGGALEPGRLPISSGAAQVLFREERNRPRYEQWSTQTSLRILRNGLATLVLILILVPLFFRSSVRGRLWALMAGLDQVNRGDLSGNLPTTVNDEVGQLASSFNKMTGALARYQSEMEHLVEERTADLRATQAQLVEQEKLASLGALAAGIAHEIKNPLNFVNNFADVSAELTEEAIDALSNDDLDEAMALLRDLRGNSEQITRHGRRADDIVRGMMQHARGGTSERQTVAVNAFVEEYVSLALHGRKANDHGLQTRVERAYGEDTGTASILPQELGRVILNLVGNAFDAVQEREDALVTISTARNGQGVEIRVSDNGPGIPEAVRQRVFEPFFTTKAAGQGTGLGLSISHDIVTKAHGGELSVTNLPTGGASFLVRLPV